MVHKLKSLKNRDSGFTIIEVLIVLAIAGLIILIVFLAVPALQRNQRNTRRRNDAAHLLGLVNEYSTNNNGKVPTGGIACPGATAAADQLDLGKENFSSYECNGTDILFSATAAPTTETNPNLIHLELSALCADQQTSAAGSGRQFVALFAVEKAGSTTGTSQCQAS
jgi:prepilin-type N-terminal cleavage/methylation domain-containing protein